MPDSRLYEDEWEVVLTALNEWWLPGTYSLLEEQKFEDLPQNYQRAIYEGLERFLDDVDAFLAGDNDF